MSVDILQTVLVRTLLVSFMASMGMNLTFRQLGRAIMNVRLMAVVLVLNFVGSVALAMGLIELFGLPPEIGAGLVLCAIAPGAVAGPVFTQWGKGDLPTAIALMIICVFATIAFAPPIASYLLSDVASGDHRFSAVSALWTILTFVMLPLFAGLTLRHFREDISGRLDPILNILANVCLAILATALIIFKGGTATEHGWMPPVATILFIAVMSVCALLVPGSRGQRVALLFTSATRGTAVALLIADEYFGDQTSFEVLLYALVSYIFLPPLALALRRIAKREDAAAASESAGASQPEALVAENPTV